MINHLKKGFKEAVDKGVTDYMIYYSGHGEKETGEWIVYLDEPSLKVEDERITIEEIFDIAYESRFDGFLQITSDSCYAGKLAFSAKKVFERRVINNLNYLKTF